MSHFPAPLGTSVSGQSRDETVGLRHLPLALFDEIECGLIVCDGAGQVHFANQSALQELGSRCLLLNADGVLRCAPGVNGEVENALRQAAQRGRRSLVHLKRGEDLLMVSMLPLRLEDDEMPHVLVMLGRRQPCSDLGLEMLAGCYGLTLAERRVLAALVREATPREIAREHAVALSTVRTQISSIRAKLGTRNVEGLLLRASQVPPVASALRMVSRAAAPMLAAA